MKKRLTEPQFHEAIKGLDVGPQTLEIARGVLIDGKPQKEFATVLGLSRGAISQAVNRVWAAHQELNLPEGYVRVSAILPEHRHSSSSRSGLRTPRKSGNTRNERMKTLVVANQKGGVGKTSTLVHLAFDFLERGLKVVVIDLDTQANASYTLQSFRSGLVASELFAGVPSGSWPQTAIDFADPHSQCMTLIASDIGLANLEKKMSLADAGSKFREAIKTLEGQGFDVCLIDTAPSLGVTMAAALLAADYVL
jgi:Mrp family chromosome partitioning ATPase